MANHVVSRKIRVEIDGHAVDINFTYGNVEKTRLSYSRVADCIEAHAREVAQIALATMVGVTPKPKGKTLATAESRRSHGGHVRNIEVSIEAGYEIDRSQCDMIFSSVIESLVGHFENHIDDPNLRKMRKSIDEQANLPTAHIMSRLQDISVNRVLEDNLNLTDCQLAVNYIKRANWPSMDISELLPLVKMGPGGNLLIEMKDSAPGLPTGEPLLHTGQYL